MNNHIFETSELSRHNLNQAVLNTNTEMPTSQNQKGPEKAAKTIIFETIWVIKTKTKKPSNKIKALKIPLYRRFFVNENEQKKW